MTGASEPIKTIQEESNTTTFNSLVGINEAAKLTRRGKGQISQDSKSGRLSYEVDERNYKKYRVSELARVYGLKPDANTSSQVQSVPDNEPINTIIENAVLKERVARLESENQYLKQTYEKLQSHNERLTMLLTAPPPAPTTSPIPRPGFWERLFSRKK